MVILIIGMYLNDVITELKNRFSAIRRDSKFAQLSEKEWIAFQIDYITKSMGHNDLKCIERSDYFKKVIQQCIGYDKIKKSFEINGITCFDCNKKMRIFYIFTPLDGSNRIMYTLNDEEKIMPITQDRINSILGMGIRILSQKRKDEYIAILSDDSKFKNEEKSILSDIRSIASSPDVMEKIGEASSLFNEFLLHTKKGCDWIHD